VEIVAAEAFRPNRLGYRVQLTEHAADHDRPVARLDQRVDGDLCGFTHLRHALGCDPLELGDF